MSPAGPSRRLSRPILLAAGLLLLGSSTVVAQGNASAVPSPEAGASPSASVGPGTPVAASSAVPDASSAAYPPLPEQVAPIPSDLPTVSIGPESEPGMLVVGTPIEYTLRHCGLWSPVDLDGSLWQPVGGTEASGAPIASDEAVGELINATPGQFVLLTPDTAEFRSASGTIVTFIRAPGELDYPLCM